MFSAAAVSSLTSLPLAIVASTGTAYSVPGKLKSEVYCARPLTLRGPSTRGVSRPTGEAVWVFCVVGMFAPSVESACRHLEGVCQAAPGQLNLEPILALRFGVAHSRFRRFAKVGCIGGLTNECGLGLGGSPRFVAHTAQSNASPRHFPALDRLHVFGRLQLIFV